ncbi:MAG: arginine deiminase-related protein [Arenimonas sp.]
MPGTSMLTRDIDVFFRFAKTCEPSSSACAKAVYLVSPEVFSLAAESAQDNTYMDLQQSVRSDLALAQHMNLVREISKTMPAIAFPGRVETPDAVFPNNVFATAKNKIILGHMRHPVRKAEADRADILGFFGNVLSYELIDLRTQAGICELTGSLIIDRARNIAYCGLSERCDEAGAKAMVAAFDLKACLLFELAPGEYHTNVVLTILASRAVIVAPDGFADTRVCDAIVEFYAPNAAVLSALEKNAFAANAISLNESTIWMSQKAADTLSSANRSILEQAGFNIHAVDLSEIEKAGGSLRCCVGEIF